MNQPPYQRIASEIRGQITAGELRLGDSVPSARAITRRWGVALATATKVLALLNSEGLTRSVPGRGTVVAAAPAAPPAAPASQAPAGTAAPESAAVPAPAAPAAPPAAPELTRGRIVAAAIRVADAEGLGQLSMRRIATELHAAPMSLYRYVSGKDELLDSMMDSVLGEERLPLSPPSGWRARLELSCRMVWRGFRRHPWLAPALSITRPQLLPNGMRHTEWVLRALDGLGLTTQEMMHIHITLFSHVRGLALNLEAEAQAEQDTGLTSEEWMATQKHGFRVIAGGGDFPMLTRLVDSDLDMDLDVLFEFGLARLLDGIERHLAARLA